MVMIDVVTPFGIACLIWGVILAYFTIFQGKDFKQYGGSRVGCGLLGATFLLLGIFFVFG